MRKFPTVVNGSSGANLCANACGLPIRSRFGSQEAGVTLVFFALMLFGIFGIAALVIDHGKEEISVYQLQRSADAAALAGARRLNGQITGWWEAKKAAVVTLKSNPIHGMRGDLSALSLPDGTSPYWDNLSNAGVSKALGDSEVVATAPVNNRGTDGSAGNLEVSVERGVYWSANDGYEFIGLESPNDKVKAAASSFLVANAVRVKVTLKQPDTFFGRVFGAFSFPNLSREAIAVMDEQIEFEAAPIGIPLCNVLLDTRPTTLSGSHLMDRVDHRMQCEREYFATEPAAKGDLRTDLDSQTPGANVPNGVVTREERTEGLIRLEASLTLPYFLYNGQPNLVTEEPGYRGWALNPKALPAYGAIGVSSSTFSTAAATGEDVVRAFEAPRMTKVGDYFRPLLSLSDLSTPGKRDRIARVINDSPSTIKGVFMDGADRQDGRDIFQNQISPLREHPEISASCPKTLRTDQL